MNMDTAGVGLMAPIAHLHSFGHELLPGHFVPVEVKRHGMGDDLKSIIETSVMLAVGQRLFCIGDIEQSSGVAGQLTGTVDLQFDTHITRAVSIEDRIRFEVVTADHLVLLGLLVAGETQRLIVFIVIQIVGRLDADHMATVRTVCVVVLEAGTAQHGITGSGIVIRIYADSAVTAEYEIFTHPSSPPPKWMA